MQSALDVEQEDRPAYVRFETRPMESRALTLKEGRSMSVDVDFVLVTPPYSKDVVESKVDVWLENKRVEVKNGRTPKEYLDHWTKMYDAFKEGKDLPLNGTPIKTWSALSPAQITNLIGIKILTVEDLAQANDEGVRRMGMGGLGLKKLAINWLKSAEDTGGLALRATELEKANEGLQVNLDALEEKFTKMAEKLAFYERQPQIDRMAVEASEPTIAISDILDEPEPDIIVEHFKTLTNPSDSIMTPHKEYEQLAGKPPNKNWKESTIIAKIKELK